MRVFGVLTNIKRYDAVGRVGRRGFELQSRFLQAQDVREDVLVQASDQVKLGGIEEEAGLLKFDGDCHFTRASVNWEMGNLWTEAMNQTLVLNQQRSRYGFPSCDGSEREGGGLTYSRYGLGRQDAKAPGGVLWRVEFPSAEVQFVRKRGGEDHPDDIQVVGLLR